MAERGDGMAGEQWSWWESPDQPPTAVQPPVPEEPPAGRGVQAVLLAVVVVLAITLAVVSYRRIGGAGNTAGASATTTTEATTTTGAGQSTTTTTTTTTSPTSTTTTATTTATNVPAGEPPAAPANVRLVEIGPTTARIEWTSEQCVGSRYQVGDFAEGGGGYPNVDRCWTDHVVLAGDPSFSPLLEPDTEYVVRIHAVGRDGQLSEPRFITIRTTSG